MNLMLNNINNNLNNIYKYSKLYIGVNILKSNDIPKWMMNLEKEDFEFVKNFVINSGSLKALAKYYEVSYPTVRNRLNSVIKRIQSTKDNEESSLVNYVRKLAIEEKLDLNDAKQLLEIYSHEKEIE